MWGLKVAIALEWRRLHLASTKYSTGETKSRIQRSPHSAGGTGALWASIPATQLLFRHQGPPCSALTDRGGPLRTPCPLHWLLHFSLNYWGHPWQQTSLSAVSPKSACCPWQRASVLHISPPASNFQLIKFHSNQKQKLKPKEIHFVMCY